MSPTQLPADEEDQPACTVAEVSAWNVCPLCLQTTGKVTFNGKTFREFLPQRTAAYIDQVDNHYPELTVRETFDFAARTQGEMPTCVLGSVLPPLVFAAWGAIHLPCLVNGHAVAAQGHTRAAWAQVACMPSLCQQLHLLGRQMLCHTCLANMAQGQRLGSCCGQHVQDMGD